MGDAVQDVPVVLRLARLPHGEGLRLPEAQTLHSAGFDIAAAVEADTPLILAPQARALVPCGFMMALPGGFEAQIRPRSGLALRHGVTVLNSPGTIDADYRGEVQVLLVNLGDAPFEIARGDRIAQLVVQALPRVGVEVVGRDTLDDTARGAGGFGSTGV